MKTSVTNFSVLVFLGIATLVRAQTYQVSVSQRPYEDLVGGQTLVNGTWELLEFEVPLGFSLALFSDTIETLHSADFFAGGFVASSLDFEDTNLILAFSTDLLDRGNELDSALSPVTYKTEGMPGSKIFTLEFENAGFLGGETENNIYTDYINYQMIIYEASGTIEVHIGPYSITNPGLDFEGFAGPSIGLTENFDFINEAINGEICLLAGDPLAPEIITSVEEILDPLFWPIPENTVYRFYRQSTKVDEPNLSQTVNYYSPNPASGNIRLQSQWIGKIMGPVTIISASDAIVSKDFNPEVIEMEAMPNGVYQLYFETTQGPALQRILHIGNK